MGRPENLAEIIGRELKGFKLVEVYFLHRDGGFIQPAILRETGKTIVCTDFSLLSKVEKMMPRIGHQRKTVLALVDSENGYGFFVSGGIGRDDKPFIVFTEEDFDRYAAAPNPFRWA